MTLKLFSYTMHFIRCMLKNSSSIQSVTLTNSLTAKENTVPPPCYVGTSGLKKGYLGSERTSFVVESLTIFLSLVYTGMLVEIGQTINNFND